MKGWCSRNSGRHTAIPTPSRAACPTLSYSVTHKAPFSSCCLLCRSPNTSAPCSHPSCFVPSPSLTPGLVYKSLEPPLCQLLGISSSQQVHPFIAPAIGIPSLRTSQPLLPQQFSLSLDAVGSCWPWETESTFIPCRNFYTLMPECLQKLENIGTCLHPYARRR